MQYTLLQLTQTILSSMESDEISSITDTVEAQQVALIIRDTYYDIVNRAELPRQYNLIQLEETSASTPTVMTLPTSLENIQFVKYDIHTTDDTDLMMRTIPWCDNATFMERMYALDDDDTTNNATFTFVPYSTGPSLTFIVPKLVAPQYYTSFNDSTFVFNSYDSAIETYLRKTKSLTYGQFTVTWNSVDAFIPDLDDKQFSILLNEAKSLAFTELKQVVHAKAEQNAKRAWVNLHNNKTKIPLQSNLSALQNYGRK